MQTWDDVHEAYHSACRGEPEPRILKAFIDGHPDFALALIEVSFVAVGMAWTARYQPDLTGTPEFAALLSRVRADALARLADDQATGSGIGLVPRSMQAATKPIPRTAGAHDSDSADGNAAAIPAAHRHPIAPPMSKHPSVAKWNR